MGLLDFIIKVSMDASGVKKGADDVEARFSAMSATLGKKLAATFSLAATTEFFREIAMGARETQHLAEQLNTTAEQVERLKRFAAKKGLDDEIFIKAVAGMRTAMAKAIEGDKETIQLFESLGLSFDTIAENSKDAAAAIELLGKRLRDIGPENLSIQQRVGLGKIFGKQGARLVTPLADLDQITALYSPEQREALEKYAETWVTLEKKSSEFFKRFAAQYIAWNRQLYAFVIGRNDFLSQTARATARGVKGSEMKEGLIGEQQFVPSRPPDPEEERNIEALGKLAAKLYDLREKNLMESLTKEEQIQRLTARRLELQRANELEATHGQAFFEREIEIEGIRGEVGRLRRRESSRSLPILSDALARVGNFVGGAARSGGTVMDYQGRSLKAQERTAQAVEEINKKGSVTIF